MVTGSTVSSGYGGLREGGHIDTFGAQPSLLCAGKKMQSGRNRVSVTSHCVHDKYADDRPKRLTGVPGGRRRRRLSGIHQIQ